MKAQFGVSVLCMASGGVQAPVRQLLNPIELSRWSFICSDGLRRSASINKTLRSSMAKCFAIEIAVDDFPSDGVALVINNVFGKPFSDANIRPVQSVR